MGNAGRPQGEESRAARLLFMLALADVDCTRLMTAYGALWGRGEMSIESVPVPGDEEGRGGVVVPSRPSTVPNRLLVNNERRGVANSGLVVCQP